VALSLERYNLKLEALQLREFGYTQQEIADTLGVPRVTITKWLNSNKGNGMNNGNSIVHTKVPDNVHETITLYPYKYEDCADKIPAAAVDLIVTDPPYLLRLNRKQGEWIEENIPEDGGNPQLTNFSRLEDVGINRNDSPKFRRLAKTPDKEFEGYIADMKDRAEQWEGVVEYMNYKDLEAKTATGGE